MNFSLLRLALLSLFIFSSISFAQNYPVSSVVLEKIKKTFYENGKISKSKIENYKKSLLKRADQVEENIYNFEVLKKGKSSKKGSKAIAKNDYINNLHMLVEEWINKIDYSLGNVNQIEYLSKIIDIENATLSEITPRSSEKYLFKMLGEAIFNYRIYKNKLSSFGEANNLVDPKTGLYFSQTELKNLEKQNIDISKLNPPADNGIIEDIKDISKVDVIDRYVKGNNDLHRGLMKGFPKNNIGFFKKIKKTQTRPKLIFETRDEDGKFLNEFKLKMGEETHSEPTAAALGTALGLYHDLSKFVRDFKIYIGDMTFEEFSLDFASYFEYDDLEKLVASHGYDETHGNYIIFKEGLLEARFEDEDLNRIGPFYPGEKKGKRETRALLLFNMWVYNSDLKPGENNKTIIRNDKSGKKIFYLQHDVGYGFGDYAREKPTDFPWKMVRKDNNKRIIFNFRSFIPNQGWKHVTFNDGRWMVRKIAQLTREQITQAVRLGNWPNKAPYNYEGLLIEKLIHRRNQLVKAFDLIGDTYANGKKIILMKVNRSIESEARVTKGFLPNQVTDFRPGLKYHYLFPAMKSLRDAIVDGVAGATSSINRVRLNSGWFGLESVNGIVEVLTGTGRQIVKNPDPTGEHDRFIVRENFRMGLRLGSGLILSGEGAYIKKYSLIYPVKSPEEASNHGKWIFDISMPYRVAKNFLPKNHILITESFVEVGPHVRAVFPNSGILSGGVDGRANKVRLNRTIITKKEGKPVSLVEDRAKYADLSARIFSRILFVSFNHLITGKQKGKLQRQEYVLEKENSVSSIIAIDKAFMNSDFDELSKHSTKHSLDSNFTANYIKLNLFGFWNYEQGFRQDNIFVYEHDHEGKLLSVDHQLEGTYLKRNFWRALLNKEEKIARVTMSSKVTKSGKVIEPFISFSFQHFDVHTKAKEIDNGYIPFINGVAENDKFLNFTASNHSFNKLYGNTNLFLKIKYYEEGINKLLKVSKDEFYGALSDVVGVSKNKLLDLKKSSKNTFDFHQKRYRLNRLQNKAKKVFSLLYNSQQMMGEKKKIKHLVKALAESVPRKGQSQNPVLLATLNRIVGQENYYLSAEIDVPEAIENKLPGRVVLFNSLGNKRAYGERELQVLDMQDALLLYQRF